MMIRKLLRWTLICILLAGLGLGALLLHATLTDFSPEPGSVEVLQPESLQPADSLLPDTFSVLIWNIGYAGLGAEMDFFNDGGKQVRASEEQSARYLKAISLFLQSMRDSADFMLLQEVDRNSKRSYQTDQVKIISEALPRFRACFALNYHVRFVPVPFGLPYTPMGKTYGGLLSLSRYAANQNMRVQYPGGFDWPTRIYMLDRCALEQRFRTRSGRELLLVNTHNTAYDATGAIKKEELAFMKKRYEAEQAKGTAVLIGGDWNQVPPGFSSTHFSKSMPEGYTPQSLDAAQLPTGFSVSLDSSVATNRSNDKPYKPESTYTTLIDYFMHSPDLEVLHVEGLDMQFRYSDHQPVRITVCFKPASKVQP